MQGRLLPKYNNRYQAHPVGYWENEFKMASEIGLDLIEFILDENDYKTNPLLTSSGQSEIKAITTNKCVKVRSICADYFMTAPLHSNNSNIVKLSLEVFVQLIKSANKLEIKDIVLPCVDQSSIKDEKLRGRFIEVLKDVLDFANENKVNISLETDLNPKQFNDLIEKLNSPCIKVNYDIGNSASLGYKFEDELESYGGIISDIHIKDRMLYGGSVILGQGNADISGFLRHLRRYDYKGPFIMQAYRDNEGITVFKKQFKWFKRVLKENFYE